MVWRAAEPTAGGLPVGAEIKLRGNEVIAGRRGIAFETAGLPEGHARPFHIELVADQDLEEFLLHRTWWKSEVPGPDSGQALCEKGRFLLNDPRVGLFNNQRISSQAALVLAAALRRTLVLPGFFKFPHPNQYEGTEWVTVRQLFNWSTVKACYSNVIELGELLDRCGPGVLDEHVAVPFQTLWMRSKSKAPWINGTRPELVWQDPFGNGTIVRLRPRESRPEMPIRLSEPQWRFLRSLLEEGVADARTVRVHGLITNVTTLMGPTCFFPQDEVLDEARSIVDKMHQDIGGQPRILGLHLRLFSRSTNKSGGYIPPELADRQEDLCNMGPGDFVIIVSHALVVSFKNFWPTHTYVATNEARTDVLMQYLAGFPGPRRNPYTPAAYDRAVTQAESVTALRSVLVDAMLCAWADYFLGNACSTMSEYVYHLRWHIKQPFESAMLLAGEQHASLLEAARKAAQEDAEGWVEAR